MQNHYIVTGSCYFVNEDNSHENSDLVFTLTP